VSVHITGHIEKFGISGIKAIPRFRGQFRWCGYGCRMSDKITPHKQLLFDRRQTTRRRFAEKDIKTAATRQLQSTSAIYID